MSKGGAAWSTHVREAGLGALSIPAATVGMVTHVSVSVATSGAPRVSDPALQPVWQDPRSVWLRRAGEGQGVSAARGWQTAAGTVPQPRLAMGRQNDTVKKYAVCSRRTLSRLGFAVA